jgi:hypothetical protein
MNKPGKNTGMDGNMNVDAYISQAYFEKEKEPFGKRAGYSRPAG